MFSPKKSVIESNIPSATEPQNFSNGFTVKRAREQDDITEWMTMQDDWEQEAIVQEFSNKQHREFRQSY